MKRRGWVGLWKQQFHLNEKSEHFGTMSGTQGLKRAGRVSVFENHTSAYFCLDESSQHRHPSSPLQGVSTWKLLTSTSSSRLSSSAAVSPSCRYILEASRRGRAQVVPTFRAAVKYNSALCGFPYMNGKIQALATLTRHDVHGFPQFLRL